MASAFLNSTPTEAPLPVATMIDIGVAKPERARAGDDQHGDRVHDRVSHSRLGTDDRPNREGRRARSRSRSARSSPRPRRRASESARGFAARPKPSRRCAPASVSEPTFSARIKSAPVPLTVAPIRRSPDLLLTGIGSPVTIASSTCARAFDHDAVDGHLFSRSDPQPISDAHFVERDVSLLAVGRRHGARSSAQGRAACEWPRRSDCARAAPAPGRAGSASRSPRRPRSTGPLRRARCETIPGKGPGEAAPPRCSRRPRSRPSPISVNMFRLRFFSDATARSRNGKPAHRQTGVASASSSQPRARPGSIASSGVTEQHVAHATSKAAAR